MEGANNMVISAYEVFAVTLNAEELYETLEMIASVYVVVWCTRQQWYFFRIVCSLCSDA